ncbi:MAG: DUF1887 family protein [Lunatimonas sp.]|uniref:Card1-like endonuclease domain-containing protein n=1 Tax=Lunatimonas sp. TaxID=2060141 RepID=UPI00263A5284|nr:DUF1887 family CARF protein [Lunatimonas sp.]MCC5938409.1 DUF1887 family protein [Lunatimonas sp.]
MPHLLSIISDQAVPNLLFIKQFEKEDSQYFFVTTKEMEGKQTTDHLIAALKLPEHKCHKILIDANDALLIFEQLKAFPFPKEASYLVNITGGNKLMSQMVFQHFLDFEAMMYYAPIGSDQYQVLYPEVGQVPKSQTIKTSLDDYLRAYGYLAESSLEYYEGRPSPKILMQQVLQKGHPGKVYAIAKATDHDYKLLDKNYLMGEWFEMYCYDYFRKAFELDESQIACSVGVKRADSHTPFDHDNEFDLMFVHRNDLYVFECKVFPSGNAKMDRISKPLFKLASLTQQFGLKCKKYLAVLGSFSQDPKSLQQLENLRQNLGISKILDIDAFMLHSGKDILREDMNFKINQLLEKFNG